MLNYKLQNVTVILRVGAGLMTSIWGKFEHVRWLKYENESVNDKKENKGIVHVVPLTLSDADENYFTYSWTTNEPQKFHIINFITIYVNLQSKSSKIQKIIKRLSKAQKFFALSGSEKIFPLSLPLSYTNPLSIKFHFWYGKKSH